MADIKSWIDINKSILKNKDIQWFGKLGIYKIYPGFIAEITLDGGSTSSWSYYRVRLISVATGSCITSMLFHFSEWCEKDFCGRQDWNGNLHLYAQDGSEPRWYIHKPKDTKALEKAIFDYTKTIL
jgi:hypothetical protein